MLESRQPEPKNIESSISKLCREEESSRCINSFDLSASCVGATRFNIVHPERQPFRIRLTIQEVVIMLTYKKFRIVQWVCRRRNVIVIQDRYCRNTRVSQYRIPG